MSYPSNTPLPTLQHLSAAVVVKYTHPDLTICNYQLCSLLLDLAIKHNQLRTFRVLLERWPYAEANLKLKAVSLHYLQSLGILEHQGVVSKVLRRVYVHAPYAGYTSTNVLCNAALGLLEDYSCHISQVKQKSEHHNRRPKKRTRYHSNSSNTTCNTTCNATCPDTCSLRRTLSIYTPLNINGTNIKSLLRYLRTPPSDKVINVIPSAIIFTSIQSALIFKALDLVSPLDLRMLGINFSLQSDEELASEKMNILNRLKNLCSVSLEYNYLSGYYKESNLINSLKSLPNLHKLDLSGNILRNNVCMYVSPTIQELVIGNTYPTVETLARIGAICGKHLLSIKLSDNGMEARLAGLQQLLSQCEVLVSLDLAGNQFTSASHTRRLLDALQPVENSLKRLVLSHSMLKQAERECIIAEMSRFPLLEELVLGPYLPDLFLTEEIMEGEWKLLSEQCARPDISMLLRTDTPPLISPLL